MASALIAVYPTSDILELLDTDEYTNLDESLKDLARLVIVCGAANMLRSGRIYKLLTEVIFPTGATHDALVEKFVL